MHLREITIKLTRDACPIHYYFTRTNALASRRSGYPSGILKPGETFTYHGPPATLDMHEVISLVLKDMASGKIVAVIRECTDIEVIVTTCPEKPHVITQQIGKAIAVDDREATQEEMKLWSQRSNNIIITNAQPEGKIINTIHTTQSLRSENNITIGRIVPIRVQHQREESASGMWLLILLGIAVLIISNMYRTRI